MRSRRGWWRSRGHLMLLAGGAVFAGTLTSAVLQGQQIFRPIPTLQTLRGVRVPEPANLADFIADRQAAIVLGKALFWDMQVGSDNIVSCASCHFSAGADNRIKNQINPGLRGVDGAIGRMFDPTATGGGGPNYKLRTGDFPFHQLLIPDDRESAVLFTSDDVVSSAGVFNTTFEGLVAGREVCGDAEDNHIFAVGGEFQDPFLEYPDEVHTRKVEPRNTPTVINAVFNFRNFWDGRANNRFNGRNPFGNRDVNAKVWQVLADGSVAEAAISLENSSAASQAVGPPLSDFEMSCAGKSFSDLGRKMLTKRALALQTVAADDSVLGPHRSPTAARGLALTYRDMIKNAFQPKYWNAATTLPNGYKMMEDNFSLYFGLAIQMYEATLVSDDSPFDKFMSGTPGALSTEQRLGKTIFEGKGQCVNCHLGPEFTSAASNGQHSNAVGGLIERMTMADGLTAIYDEGFYNIGVTPTGNDMGLGVTDPWGNPLSYTRQHKLGVMGQPVFDPFTVNSCIFAVFSCFPVSDGSVRDATDGTFKTPTLRNVELTGPYFHNGGYATLESVVDFYNRGGNRRALQPMGDTSAYGPNTSNADLNIRPLFLTDPEKAALVAFLKSLTDERVRWEIAPFDHPSLRLTNGQSGDEFWVAYSNESMARALDAFTNLPAVGAGGRATLGLQPIKPFTPIP
jgi:cytochrome c peroxidase